MCSLSGSGVLRVRLHAAGVSDFGDCHRLCDHCGDILPAQRRELSLAMDLIPVGSFDIIVSTAASDAMQGLSFCCLESLSHMFYRLIEINMAGR